MALKCGMSRLSSKKVSIPAAVVYNGNCALGTESSEVFWVVT